MSLSVVRVDRYSHIYVPIPPWWRAAVSRRSDTDRRAASAIVVRVDADRVDLQSVVDAIAYMHPLAPTCCSDLKCGAAASMVEYDFEVTRGVVSLVVNGVMFRYPNIRTTAAEILGVLIARVSGQSLATFLRERIFEPLGMSDTGFYVPAAVFEAGGGGLVSTADDLLAFGRMMLNKGAYGRERILSHATVELMTTDQIAPEQKARSPFFGGFWDECSWGLGLGFVTARRARSRVLGVGWCVRHFLVGRPERAIGRRVPHARPDLLGIPTSILDCWTSAYQLIDD